MELADRIRECAKKLGGVKALSRKSEIPISTLNEYLAGAKLPLDRAAAIAKAAGVSLDWLATGDGHELRFDLPVRRLPSADEPTDLAARLQIAGFHEAVGIDDLYDNRLLVDALTKFELQWRRLDVQAPASKKAEAFAFCYRSFLKAGKVEDDLIEDVVALVRSPQ